MSASATRCVLLAMVFASPLTSAATKPDFSQQLVAIRATSYLLPRAALQGLQALEQATQPLTVRQQGQALEVAISAQFWLHDPVRGLELVGQLERLGAQQHDKVLSAKALLHRGYILSKSIHDAPMARKLIDQASRLAATTDDVYTKVQTLTSLGMADAEEGDPATGLTRIQRALALARAADDRDALIMALKTQASTQADLARFDEALASVDEMLALARQRGLPIQVVRADLTENEIASRAGRAARAREALRDAVAILQALGANECLPRVLVKLAEADNRAGNYAEANRLSDNARRLAAASGDPDDLALAEFESGVSQVYMGKLAAGQRAAERALAHFRDQETYVPMMLNYGQALAVAGAADAALKVYADAGSVGLALWKKEKELARESVIRSSQMQKKENENEALARENQVRSAELRNERKLKRMGWVLSIVCALGCITTAMLYRRIRVSNRSLRTLNHALYEQSTSDALTGLRNRNFFYEHVVAHTMRGVFYLIDIDHFKSINDTRGHAVGDEVLRAVSKRIAATVRAEDVLIRWGGEEFLVFVPGLDAARARETAVRLLDAVAAAPVEIGGGAIVVTASLGFSAAPMTCGGETLSWEQQVHLADLALYLAKANGRDRGYGVCGPRDWTPQRLRAAEHDLGQAAAQGWVELLRASRGVKDPHAPGGARQPGEAHATA